MNAKRSKGPDRKVPGSPMKLNMLITVCIRQALLIAPKLWKDNELVGGLYGIRLGNVFFGESMFSKISNASRLTFIKYVRLFKTEGVELIDCQIYTEYLESMGAQMIPRTEFIVHLE